MYEDIIADLEMGTQQIKEWRENVNTWYYDVIGRYDEFIQYLSAWQLDFINFFERPENMVSQGLISAGRGCAKTFTTCCYAARQAFFNPSLKIGIYAGSQEQADNGYRYMRKFFEAPLMARKIDGKFKENDMTELIGGGYIVCLPASDTIRGYRFNITLGDEAILIPDKLIEAADGCLNGVPGIQQRFLFSTPNRMDTLFYKLWNVNVELPVSERTYHLMRIPVRPEIEITPETHNDKGEPYWAPWVSDERIALKKKELEQGLMSKATWDIEYMGIFAQERNPVFAAEQIQDAYQFVNIHQKWDYINVGFDWGVEHETVAMIVGVKDKKYYVLEAFHASGGDYEDIVDKAFNYLKQFNCRINLYPEASAVGFYQNKYVKQKQGRHMRFLPVSFIKQKQDRIVALSEVFRKEKIAVSKHLRILYHQLMTYYRRETQDVKKLGRMPQAPDDHVDALMFSTWDHERVMQPDRGSFRFRQRRF